MDDDFVGDDIDAASVRELWLIWTADLLQRGFFRSSTAPVKKLHCDQDAISERIHLNGCQPNSSAKFLVRQKPALLEICLRKFVFIRVLSNYLIQMYGRCMQRIGALFLLCIYSANEERLICHTNICHLNTSFHPESPDTCKFSAERI